MLTAYHHEIFLHIYIFIHFNVFPADSLGQEDRQHHGLTQLSQGTGGHGISIKKFDRNWKSNKKRKAIYRANKAGKHLDVKGSTQPLSFNQHTLLLQQFSTNNWTLYSGVLITVLPFIIWNKCPRIWNYDQIEVLAMCIAHSKKKVWIFYQKQ